MNVDDIFLEKAHEKELYITKKLIKRLFKNYEREEKKIRNELKERIPKMVQMYTGQLRFDESYDIIPSDKENLDNFNDMREGEEGEISLLLKKYEELIEKLIKELKPTLVSSKDKPYKKEVISVLRKNFKELRKDRAKRLSKIFKKMLVERKFSSNSSEDSFIHAKAKVDYGILWHGASIENFENIIKERFFRKRLFLTHHTIQTTEGKTGNENVTLLINIRGFKFNFGPHVRRKEIIITEKVPIDRILKVYTREQAFAQVKNILDQNNLSIPLFVEERDEYKKDEKEVLLGVHKLHKLYINKYEKLGVEMNHLREEMLNLEKKLLSIEKKYGIGVDADERINEALYYESNK